MPSDSQSPGAALQRAQALAAANQHAEAAAEFARLAGVAENDRNQRRAGNTHALAALAYASAGDGINALEHARGAFKHFVQMELYSRAPAFYQTMVKRLEARKLTRALDTLRAELSAKMVIFQNEARKEALPRTQLPAACPGCSLPMRPDEVDWISSARAECDYCGTVVDAV
jgi:hypothetical protein